jgi:hypothetical protein
MSYFHPQRMPELPARRRKAARQQLEHVVEQSATSRVRRRPPLAIAAAIVIVVLSTGAAGFVVYHAITDTTRARCYTVANADASGRYYTTIAEASKPATKADVSRALSFCAGLFRAGELRKGHPVGHSGFKQVRHAPQLVPCIWHDGTAAVFPGHRGTCKKLGLTAAARR